MSSTTMASGIIKGSPTSCCSVGLRKLVGTGLYNVATGWVGSCVITIKRLHELAGKSWRMAVRLRPRQDQGRSLLANDRRRRNHESRRPSPAQPARSSYRAVKDWDSDKRRSISALNRQDPRIIFLTIRVSPFDDQDTYFGTLASLSRQQSKSGQLKCTMPWPLRTLLM